MQVLTWSKNTSTASSDFQGCWREFWNSLPLLQYLPSIYNLLLLLALKEQLILKHRTVAPAKRVRSPSRTACFSYTGGCQGSGPAPVRAGAPVTNRGGARLTSSHHKDRAVRKALSPPWSESKTSF